MEVWRNGRWTARKCKTSPEELLPEYDAWLWMDNEIYFTYEPHSLFEAHLGEYDLAVHKHCDRNCIYQEIQAATRRQPQRDPIEKLVGQSQAYKEENYPKNIGLYENGILYRKNNEQIRSFNKLWFEETAKWNTEDQVSMMYSLWRHPEVNVNALHQTFVMHTYQNQYLPLTDQFKCLPRSMRYVKE
jgi:lipopolysaccharide biosynthesis glycosyltransferase